MVDVGHGVRTNIPLLRIQVIHKENGAIQHITILSEIHFLRPYLHAAFIFSVKKRTHVLQVVRLPVSRLDDCFIKKRHKMIFICEFMKLFAIIKVIS